MTLLLKGGRVVDPSRKADGTGDLLIENGKIAGSGGELHQAGKSRGKKGFPPAWRSSISAERSSSPA